MKKELTWKQIQNEYNNKTRPKKIIPKKSDLEQLQMTKSECMKYIKKWYLCNEAQIKLLTDKELCMEYIKKGWSLCNEAEIKLLTDKELCMEYIKKWSLCNEAQIKLFNMED